ncbi:hypothetical protein [Cystobacter fuscus]|uniref:hypothetical protein n=1 Tax=Cystobacter fuscus TaxID=43 RepID=UPI002B2F9CC0|nr:hypothetical protein F0U63_26145 [Cystobacter fuscus]
MSDDDSREHLLARVECAVRGGFEDEEELLEELEPWVEDELGESDRALVETLDAHARMLFQAQRSSTMARTWSDASRARG